ncbi:hypothetical protein [Streptacidiphilus fuscans]|uniref:Uncharacterized protein n=1 Tax=Streptacidiphilus fuscans TaxID=2789292 RepID=A0A931B806_9ACTN|nr:hypothetical protein [Streptacidiphilus fuscans]MBF9070362.1 hypothetical protein [Streptacidiphilus fuscans]
MIMQPALWTRLVQIFGTLWLTCCVLLIFPVLPLGWWIAAVFLHGLLGLLAAVLYLVGNALVSALALYESRRNVGRSRSCPC